VFFTLFIYLFIYYKQEHKSTTHVQYELQLDKTVSKNRYTALI